MEKSDRRNPIVYLFGKTWQYSKGNRKMVVFYLLMFIVSECINTFWMPLVMARMINIITSEGIGEHNLKRLLSMLLLIPLGSVLSWLFHGPARYFEENNAFMARANYRECQLQGVLNLPLEWHTEHHTGKVIDKMEKGAQSVYEFSSETFQFLKPIITLFGCFGAVVYFSNISAFIVIAIMLVGAYITVRIDKICGPIISDLSRQENTLSESIHDAVNNISTIITLRVEGLVFSSIMNKVMKPIEAFRRNARFNEIKWFLTSFCTSIMTALVIGTYFFENQGGVGKVSIASFYLVASYLDKISGLFYQFTSLYGWTIRRMFRLLNSEQLCKDFRQTNFTNHLLPANWREIKVKNLSFSYGAPEGAQHLDGVSFNFRNGEKIAVVGESGSGKSTLLRVMRDLYHPQTQTVMVDGVRIPTGFEGICRAITLVQQDPQILERTIRGNITLDADYDQSLIEVYADVACFSEVVESLPKGYDSMIKEKGVNLSGGQVQRLSLARGLLAGHDKDIVLLDEPTSSLDAATSTQVWMNILRKFKAKTVISSVHTLQILPMFDRVFMFNEGRIIGAGTVAELLTDCPKFGELWQKQFSM